MRFMFWVFLSGMLMPAIVQAKSPHSLNELLEASFRNYPKIQEAKAKRDASESAVIQAMGAFDASVDNTTNLRPGGYYDGNYTSSKLVKPLTNYNAKVAAGYRASNGQFPLYEDYYYVNCGGEFNLEFFFSLLRDRDID